MLKEYRSLLPYYKKYAPSYGAGLLFLGLTDTGLLLIPPFLKKGINLISQGEVSLPLVGALMLKMIGVAAAVALSRFFWRYFIIGSSRKIEKEFRARVHDHLMTMDKTWFSQWKTGDIMARLTNDMTAVRRASGIALVAFMDGLFMTIAILWILFNRYPRLTAILILPLPLITLMVLLAGKALSGRFRKVQDHFSALTASIQEKLNGIRLIKTFTKEEESLAHFSRDNENYIQANISLIRLWGLIQPMVAFLSGLTLCLLLFFGGKRVILGTLLPGDFVALMSYLAMLSWPMIGVGFMVNLLQRGAASLKRINGILNTPPHIKNRENPQKIREFKTLEVKNLHFSYPHSPSPVLKGINLKLEQGQSLGILGPTGSGKSTLLSLLPRILESPREQIFLNGKPIHNLELSSLRQSLSLIPQETFLFSATIKQNILYGKPNASEKELKNVIRTACLEQELKLFPKGLDTPIGEKGISLSGGQKQRIALARALLANPPVLILDDALSAVDTGTEEKILRFFFKKRSGKTNILISHRVSTLRNTSKIIVLEGGKISQEGCHENLIKQKGLYARIYKLQSLEENAS